MYESSIYARNSFEEISQLITTAVFYLNRNKGSMAQMLLSDALSISDSTYEKLDQDIVEAERNME